MVRLDRSFFGNPLQPLSWPGICVSNSTMDGWGVKVFLSHGAVGFGSNEIPSNENPNVQIPNPNE
jgi:hypothetical protein